MKDLEFLSRSLIAHRGYYNNKKGIPENSVLAFKKAIDNNYLIELDVRLTKDQKLVVFHDDNLKRVCGVNKRVKDLTYIELLKYNLFDTTLKVPLFSDVIKLVNGKVPILIETKYHNRYGVLEKILINELSNYKGLYAIQSFYPMSLLWLKRNTKDIPIGLLSSNFKNDLNCLKSIIGKTLILDLFFKTDFISYDVKGLPNNYLSYKRDKKKIVIWTIKNKKDYDLARQYTGSLICENFDWL
jgi:glycerophosphoryl diester phosphodiesterase